ncbi:protein of unknown function DUF4283 [Macleaya cordata]|uniref:CCHC-type domain-containing protein n=1 Tax=Macleaya cordata TaxID=56857 RepID=A0A200QA27_MACCD|nr:protein of unknown function DUF4283 [Macleaya cordata]
MLWKNTLIGKIQSGDKYFEPSETMKEIEEAWINLISTFTMMELDDKCFSFTFENPKDMIWVMDSRPWLISGYLLVFTEWVPSIPPSKIEFKICPFWIQAHDVPYELMSNKMGLRIGRIGGEVLEVDFDERVRERKKYMRIRVMVDVSKRLATGCWLCISSPHDDDDDNNVVVLWVSFRYEELPKMCYRCGVIGHSKTYCGSNITPTLFENYIFFYQNGEKIPVEGQVLIDPTKRGYGPWLKEETLEKEEELYGEDDQDEIGIDATDDQSTDYQCRSPSTHV